MTNFYIAEILLLPSELRLLSNDENYLEKLKEMVSKTLPEKKLNLLWFNQELESFKIEMARDIIREAQFSNFAGQETLRVLVLLNFETAGSPAQNAMLKLIEEPPTDTLIVLPVFNDNSILPTIRSRAKIKHLPNKQDAKQQQKADWPKDLAAAINLAEKYKDRSEALLFVQNLLKNKKFNSIQRQALSRTYQDLNANLNVRLCLENCFFTGLEK